MSPEMIGFLMIGAMLAGIFIGFPISFTLIFLGLVFGYWGFGELVFYLMTLQYLLENKRDGKTLNADRNGPHEYDGGKKLSASSALAARRPDQQHGDNGQ